MKIVHKILNIIIVLSILAVGMSVFMKKQLPEKDTLLPEVHKMPKQTEQTRSEFTFDYRGTAYKVTPRADYELWGLVVSHNDIGKFGDIYHDETSVDLRDICVVWGENAKSGVYKKGKYKSGSWTCYWQFKSGEAWSKFNESQIANNHLITSNPDIQDAIRELRIGDQVHVKGYLVNYENVDTEWRRETSLTRKDTGNHACEVVFVENLEILKPGNVEWYLINYLGKRAVLALVLIKIILMFWGAYREQKKIEKLDAQ
ncbi:hypothetical protein ACFL6I_23145 [candidate division KSB1 bacterium]